MSMNRFLKKIVFLLVLFIHSFGCTEKELDSIVVSSITLNVTSIEMTEGDTQSLVATISPSNATNKTVTWSSSDKTVASVSAGKVTALKAGKATITVKTEDGGKTATCKVTVKAKVYPVTGVTLDKTSATLTEGDEFVLTATVNPSNATNKTVTWSSSDKMVATVSDGKVTALKAGKATITVTTEDSGKTASCEVIVRIKSLEDWEEGENVEDEI